MAMSYADAIASIESAGSGDYAAVGPATKNGARAYGRYQVMDFNIGPWTEKYLGRKLTPEEFLASPAAQDAVFNGEFGGYVQKYGNPQDAASVWFSGRPVSQAGNSSDGYTTVPEYVRKFSAALGQTPLSYGPSVPQATATTSPQSGGLLGFNLGTEEKTGILADIGSMLAATPQPQGVMPAPRQVTPYVPEKRDTITPYLEFFNSL